jgi:hypothetical protein
VSAVAPPHVEKLMVCVAGAVHLNHTSWCAVGHVPVCCGLSVEPPVLTLNVPVPEMGVADAQSSAPCALARAETRAKSAIVKAAVEDRFMSCLLGGKRGAPEGPVITGTL